MVKAAEQKKYTKPKPCVFMYTLCTQITVNPWEVEVVHFILRTFTCKSLHSQ